MKNTKKVILTILALTASGGVFSSGTLSVDEMYEISKSNVQTSVGKKFDNEIMRITTSNKAFEPSVRSCFTKTKPRNIYGAYEFLKKSKEYRVYLQPQSEFSECISKLLEGLNLPIPPSYPYYSPFELNV